MKPKNNAVTGERTPARVTIEDWRSGRFTVDEFRERQCGQPFDGTIEAIEAERERSDKEQFEREGENDDTRTAGLPANEDADDNEPDNETPYRLRDAGSEGGGESFAERNL